MKSKLMDVSAALSHVKAGDRVMIGGFGMRGCPDMLVDALVKTGAKDLTIISNDLGRPGESLGELLRNGQIRALIGDYYNRNPEAVVAYNAGKIGVTLIPQGTLAESIRAAANGIPAYYTAASAGTELGAEKEIRIFEGKKYVLERAIWADVALISAAKADTLGNLIYCKVARNFNPAMAMAATYTIALVDEVVEPGELDPEAIVTPHIFVNAIVKGDGKTCWK